jgi:outer membrane receptor protein involved in Fe transport
MSIVGAITIYAQKQNSDTTASVKERNIDEVVVVADKRPQRILNIPAAVSLVTSKQIEQTHINNLRGITAVVPGFYMPEYGSKLTAPVYIRGVGARINNPSIGLYVDGVPYFEKSTFVFDFEDIDRIEVLRGPQGTLYGRNTMGGLINVTTRMPSNERQTNLVAEFGNYGLQRYHISHNQPIVKDKLAMMIGLGYAERDGYFTNNYNNSKVGTDNTYNGSLKFLFTPTKNIDLLYKVGGEHSKENGYPYGIIDSTNRAVVNYNYPSHYTRDLLDNSLSVTYRMPYMQLSSVSSFQYLNDKQDVDQDFLPLDWYNVIQKINQHLYSQEVTLTSRNTELIDFTTGVFAFWQDADRTVNLRCGKDKKKTDVDYDKFNNESNRGLAGYGQVTLKDIFGFIDFTTGLRYDYEYNSLGYRMVMLPSNVVKTDTTFKADFSQWMPKAALRFRVVDNFSIYTVVSKGYKSGGFNVAFEREEDIKFLPEYSWNYEIGLKGIFFDGLLTADADVFYIDWNDQQVSQKILSGKGYISKNAGKSFSKGIEGNIAIRPATGLLFGASAAYVDAEYTSFTPDLNKMNINYDGKHLPYVPRNTVSVYANYVYHLNINYLKAIRWNAVFQANGKLYWDDANTSEQAAYQLLNSQIAFELPWLEVELWGKNILDEKYHPYSFNFAGKWYAQEGIPTTFGVTLRKQF